MPVIFFLMFFLIGFAVTALIIAGSWACRALIWLTATLVRVSVPAFHRLVRSP